MDKLGIEFLVVVIAATKTCSGLMFTFEDVVLLMLAGGYLSTP